MKEYKVAHSKTKSDRGSIGSSMKVKGYRCDMYTADYGGESTSGCDIWRRQHCGSVMTDGGRQHCGWVMTDLISINAKLNQLKCFYTLNKSNFSLWFFFSVFIFTYYIFVCACVHVYMWFSAKRCACKELCTSVENKTLLKTVFIWNVVLCTCMNEWLYSTDNFSNQAVFDFKIQSSHTEKSAEKWPPKTDIHVLSDFYHFAYKQIASMWSNNHWLVHGKHCFIWII